MLCSTVFSSTVCLCGDCESLGVSLLSRCVILVHAYGRETNPCQQAVRSKPAYVLGAHLQGLEYDDYWTHG